ncbi:MAG: DUF4093 domain-containing protein [Clostridia bacterium]|nr:DUF4093 domain-containing protein [Clostridia bacterium]
MEKKKIDFPIIVEGKYDKIKIKSLFEACVITTEGFGVFKNNEKLALIKRLAEKSKIIVITDSDGAGKVIRSHITSAIPKDRLIQLYTPQVKGKEKRKVEASKEGFLGVEGTDAELLRNLLSPFATDSQENVVERAEIEKVDLFELGLTGGADSMARRDGLAVKLGLPRGMTPNALLAALNVLMSREELYQMIEK